MQRALIALVLGSAAAFNPKAAKQNVKLASKAAGAALAAAALLPAPALAGDSLVLDTPLEDKLAAFGSASYSVFNSITDAAPLADKFLEFVDAKVPDKGADVVQKAVDGVLAIPDAKVSEYAGVLKQVVFKGVNRDTCVTLGGSNALAEKLRASAAVKSVDAGKMGELEKKMKAANSAVPKAASGNICLPASEAASEKLWVAQAELTFAMPKEQAGPLVAAVAKAGATATRPAIAGLVPAAEGVFSKSGEAQKMVAAGKAVEPVVIATAKAALK